LPIEEIGIFGGN